MQESYSGKIKRKRVGMTNSFFYFLTSQISSIEVVRYHRSFFIIFNQTLIIAVNRKAFSLIYKGKDSRSIKIDRFESMDCV